MEKINIKNAMVIEGIKSQMSEASLSSKGLMPSTASDIKVPLNTFSDANDMFSGWYYFAKPILNVPISNSGFIYAHRLFEKDGISIQYCADFSTSSLYLRTGNISIVNNTQIWGGWKKIYP